MVGFEGWVQTSTLLRCSHVFMFSLHRIFSFFRWIVRFCSFIHLFRGTNENTPYTWSVCRNTDNNELGFVRFSSMTSNFLDNTCTKVQNMAFKTSQMDQIALEYWYYGSLGRLRVDGRGFLHQTPILKNCPPERNQVAAHAQKRVTVPLRGEVFWKPSFVS